MKLLVVKKKYEGAVKTGLRSVPVVGAQLASAFSCSTFSANYDTILSTSIAVRLALLEFGEYHTTQPLGFGQNVHRIYIFIIHSIHWWMMTAFKKIEISTISYTNWESMNWKRFPIICTVGLIVCSTYYVHFANWPRLWGKILRFDDNTVAINVRDRNFAQRQSWRKRDEKNIIVFRTALDIAQIQQQLNKRTEKPAFIRNMCFKRRQCQSCDKTVNNTWYTARGFTLAF